MDKKLLDNMSGQELKEMIDDEIIALEDLDNTALEKILNYETDMICFGIGDMTTIRRCSELLNERNDSDVLNKDKIISIIDKAAGEHVIIVGEEKTHESKAKVIKKHNFVLRRIGLVAAIVAVLMSVTVLVAAAFGVDIFEYICKIVRQDEGSQIIVDDFTFYHNGEAKQYSSIEEMIKSEDFDVMFPNKFPEGIEVVKVTLNENVQGNDAIHITTNSINTCVLIDTKTELSADSYADCHTYEAVGRTYYIFQEETFFAICFYNNARYYIQTESYDKLIFIIDNMKE